MKWKLLINEFLLFSAERDILPPIQLLLPEYPTFRAAPRNLGGHTPFLAGVSAQTRPQTAFSCVLAKTCTEDHKIPTATQGILSPLCICEYHACTQKSCFVSKCCWTFVLKFWSTDKYFFISGPATIWWMWFNEHRLTRSPGLHAGCAQMRQWFHASDRYYWSTSKFLNVFNIYQKVFLEGGSL